MEYLKSNIETEVGMVVFTLYKVPYHQRFLIIATDYDQHYNLFYMQKVEHWKIVDPEKLPDWLLLAEEHLDKLIEKKSCEV